MTDETVDLRVDQEIVVRLRAYAHIAHAAASWGFSGDGFWIDRGADLIEEQAAEIEQLQQAIWQALDDMGDGYCVCPAAKDQMREVLASIERKK